ncbi:MAG: crossover junction endodeoxyribonuclease RuvC [Chloroflexi bacterium]|nr:crossover junction endodeoxyribonuclease RuvC [Chloroflexota bacterium]MDA1270373.1 crossover junction endodeoxyribonuclease RuvC [Chloroflexota bacterium]
MGILGIDPGTLRMGYGLISDGPHADDYGVIALPRSMPLEKRLYQLHTHILNLISIFQPTAVAVEQPFMGKGERSFAGSAMAIGQAQAAVFIGAASQGIPIFKYAPAQVKSAVADYGAASKEQMREIVTATLGLEEIPESDAADALAVGLCHLMQYQAEVALGRIIPPGQER